MRGELRALLAQRSSIELYPPVLHQANALAAAGRVTMLDSPSVDKDPPAGLTSDQVEWVRVQPRKRSGSLITRLDRVRSFYDFARALRTELATGPDVAIAYEPDAAALLLLGSGWLRGRTMRIVHLHEVPNPATLSATLGAVANYYLQATLKRADLVIVPDAHRADIVAKKAGLLTVPRVVMNCPPVLREIPESRLIPHLRARGITTSRIVHYQGAVGSDHCLAEVIASMRHWPDDAVFVIVGSGPQGYHQALRTLAASQGVDDRVVFVPRVPYDEVLSYAVGATVGVTFLKPSTTNWEYSAGASNKRFEYAAVGIPQVTNSGPGIEELFVSRGAATAVSPTDTQAIGKGLANFLEDTNRAVAVGSVARSLHLSEYNYDRQFAPILTLIREWATRHSRTP